MADMQQIYWDEDGFAHSDCLYWEGFPWILWETLRTFHYTEPPRYKGKEFEEDGVALCSATMVIPHHPTLDWPAIEIEVVGHRLVDAFDAAALKAITTFCEQHPQEVAAYPIGLFPTVFEHDAEGKFRTTHFAHLLGDDVVEETFRSVMRYLNAHYHQQERLRQHMTQVEVLAQMTDPTPGPELAGYPSPGVV